MHRRRFLIAAPAILVGVGVDKNLSALAQAPQSVWGSGGSDPSGWSHDDALARMVADGYLPVDAAREFLLLANARNGSGRHFSTDPIEEGQSFGCMCFGGRNRGSQKRMIRNVIAKPSVWRPDAPREMRTWTWVGTIDGKRVTVGYAVPLVCGNSSAVAYKNGAPVCVPIPHNALIV